MIDPKPAGGSSMRIPAATVLLLLLVWEACGRFSVKWSLLISRPELVAAHFRAELAGRATAFAYTAFESLAGLLLAAIFAVACSVAFVYEERLTKLVYPWLVAVQVVPLIAIAPLIILIFGNGPSGKIALSILMTFFPILANLVAGFAAIPRSSLDDMRLRGASRSDVIRYVIYPFTLPYFFAGLRIAAPLSVIGSIVAEFNGADYGIGRDIFIAARRLEPEVMMASLIMGAVVAGIQYGLVRAAERLPGVWFNEGGLTS